MRCAAFQEVAPKIAAFKVKQAAKKDAKAQRRAPMKCDPEVKS